MLSKIRTAQEEMGETFAYEDQVRVNKGILQHDRPLGLVSSTFGLQLTDSIYPTAV